MAEMFHSDPCSYPDCGKSAVKEGLCLIHFAMRVWTNNTDIDNLGIWLFFKKFIPKAFKNFKYGVPRFHSEILFEVLKDAEGWTVFDRMIAIAAPRGSSKTTLLSKALVLFYCVTGLKKYIVLASKTGRAAQKNLRWLKTVLNSSYIITVFGDLRPEIKSKMFADEVSGKWTSEIIILANGVTVEAVGMGQQLRSAAEGEDVNRIDLFIADDCETDENTKTPDRRESNEVWFFETVIPSLDVDTGTIVFINTLTHENSLLAKLLASKGWRKKFYQITYFDADGVEQPLWPQKFPMRIIEAIKQSYQQVGRERSFYKEYYNLIRSEAGFNERWIKKYEGDAFYENGRNWIRYILPGAIEVNTRPAYITLGIDLSYTFSERGNFTVLLPLATTPDNRRFVLPYSRGRFTTWDDVDDRGIVVRRGVISEALRLHERYHINKIVVDTGGTQIGIYRQIVDAFKNVAHPPTIKPFRSTEEKYARLKGLLQPEYENGRVYHLAGMDDLTRELLAFMDTTDDVLDALFNAIVDAETPKEMDYDPLLLHPDSQIYNGWTGQPIKKVVNWMTL